ncbi:MAG: hypothetical protein QOG35_2400, partial [Solirubrobacteraceae bacterium]|nr:hypothetical protein [Solirubrobacteraceae bacterium]
GHMSAHANRWAAVGHSSDTDAYSAGAAAAAQALERDDAKLVVVFSSDNYDLPALLRGVNERSGGVPLIGCSTAGQIATGKTDVGGVVVTAIGGDGFSAVTAAGQPVDGALRDAGAAVAASVASLNGKQHRVVILLTDALAGDQQEVIRGAYGVLGAGVPLVGGCAGDDFKMATTYQFHGDQVLSGGVVAASLVSDAPFGIGVHHGWQRVGEPVLITRAGGNRVYELDGRPALDVYLERLNAPEQAGADAGAFGEFGLLHPLGLERRSSEDAVRFVAGADFEDRSLTMIAEVPQGGLAWFMEGDVGSVQAATDAACEDALASLGDNTPLALIAFDCAARRGVLGDAGIVDEVASLARHATGGVVAGFYSYGEIARTMGVSGIHNQTLVVLALS